MTTKTSFKVCPTVKRYTPEKYILNEVLRPGIQINPDYLITLCMREFNMRRSEAEKIVYQTLDRADNLSYADRDKLHLPNIGDSYPGYPEIAQQWKSKVKECLKC